MRTAITPEDGGDSDYVTVRVTLRLPRRFWIILLGLAVRQGKTRIAVLREAVETGIRQLHYEPAASDATIPLPDRVQDLMRLQLLVPGVQVKRHAS
jgi:predicted DNA-binding protein